MLKVFIIYFDTSFMNKYKTGISKTHIPVQIVTPNGIQYVNAKFVELGTMIISVSETDNFLIFPYDCTPT